MASLTPRTNKHGVVTSHQVKWRMDGEWQTERFLPDDEAAAEIFKGAVEEAGHRWPPGWVKGHGYVSEMELEESAFRFETYARRSIASRTGGDYYKRLQTRALENHIFPIFGNCDVRSTEHFCKDTISAWVNLMLEKKVQYGRGAEYRNMGSETLRGLIGLLSSILKEAVMAEPPLRNRNPCDLIHLPDGGGQGEDYDDAAEFMTPEEIAGLIDCFRRPTDRMLVRIAYGTGLRWGEVTALATRHVRITEPGRYEVRVTRAWKRRAPTSFYLGPPKTKAGRRSVEITVGLWQELQEFGLAEQHTDALVFHDGNGGRIRYGTFWRRWQTAIRRAKSKGILPEWKKPTFHDLRHSHIAALISDGNSLTYVQRRVGHQSIKTTSDRYGHLLDTAHLAAMKTLNRVMGTPAASDVPLAASGLAAAAVYVSMLGRYCVAFESEEDAEKVAERWVRERGGAVRVDKMTEEAWAARELPGAVHQGTARRAWVWEMGPVFYAADGSEVLTVSTASELRGSWRWDFEDFYTEEPALQVIGDDSEKGSLIPVRAYGTDEEAVRVEFAAARAGVVADATSAQGDPVTAGR
ncbi:tyrosine-type recombinase/integrase [Streptomyces sp. NPDC058548]|uniref:tyrosine-type recombinase/integrase n=1 Tax=Streptomyces sp. NPDC058548 TaxID=3346545 RepID=UPI0036562D68